MSYFLEHWRGDYEIYLQYVPVQCPSHPILRYLCAASKSKASANYDLVGIKTTVGRRTNSACLVEQFAKK